MPAVKASALEVVEAELPFEVLVDPLGSPALLEEVDELDETACG